MHEVFLRESCGQFDEIALLSQSEEHQITRLNKRSIRVNFIKLQFAKPFLF